MTTKNCSEYWKNGAEAAAMAGYSSANRARCNIKKVQHGKGMGRRTRKGSRRNRKSTRRNRK